jgi:hypothetical protein
MISWYGSSESSVQSKHLLVGFCIVYVLRKESNPRNTCRPDIDAVKNSLRTRYRQKIESEVSDNGAYDLALVIIDVLLELTAEMLDQHYQALRESIGDSKA